MTDLNFKCLIAGSGVEEASLRGLARDVGATNVQFLGRLQKEAIGELMAAGDIHFIGLNDHPLARTTMPSKLQATMASARPILGALVGDAAEAVRAAGGGWVVNPGDSSALTEALRSAVRVGRPELARQGVIAREYYDAEFSVEVGVDRIENLLLRCARTREVRL